MEPRSESATLVWPFPFVPQDWAHTLQDDLTQLRVRVEALEAGLTQNPMTSHRPPCSDLPYKKPRQRTTTPRKAGGKLGHSGHRQGGRWSKAQVPAVHATGYGPRFSALMGELAGTYGNGRRQVQTFCASVLQMPLSLGAIQKVFERVAQAIESHYTALAMQARQAPVNYIDETPWFYTHTLHWLWVMASERVAFTWCIHAAPKRLLPP
jgi:hypothetical protein